jgi:hypothetical protein
MGTGRLHLERAGIRTVAANRIGCIRIVKRSRKPSASLIIGAGGCIDSSINSNAAARK